MKGILKQISYFNAAEFSVITFVLASLIGGIVLYYTEQNRIVTVKKPYIEQVILQRERNNENEKQVLNYKENHVFVRSEQQKGETFIDSLFTAVSALCVTGLTSTDFSQFTLLGQIVVMILIQMGGLGIIVFTSLFAFAVFRGLSEHVSVQGLLANVLDVNNHQVKDMLKYVFFYTFLFEGIAFLIMGFHLQFIADPALREGINPWWWSLFHSVSAFNNAGFGLQNSNLMLYVQDPVINLVISALIILGGLGYPVLIFLYAFIRSKFFGQHSQLEKSLNEDVAGAASVVQVKVALWGTFLLLLFGFIVTLGIEWYNGVTNGLNVWEKMLVAFFQSVSTRTAGFNTIDIGALHISTLFFYMALMFIGANPAGTAGGIKIPTVAVLYGYVKDWFKAPGQPIMLLGRRISKFALSHAIRLFFFSAIFICAVVFTISILERGYLITPDPVFNFLKVMFEVVSAFGTVGLSMGFTGGVTSFSTIMTPLSKLLIIITMLFGRLGPLTILAALPWKRAYADSDLSPDHDNVERIQIG